MMWLTIGKIAIVAFLALAITFFVVVFVRNARFRTQRAFSYATRVFVRNARRKGLPSWESSGHFDQIEGAMPPMPRPDGLGYDASDDDGPPRRH